MSKVTVLGLGAMGSRMAANLLQAGHEVQVWNRNWARTAPLVALGARAAETPRAAVAGAEAAIAMLRDDEASRQVWLEGPDAALAGMAEGAVAVESSTLTVAWARELAGHCRERGIAFVDAPVAGSRPQAETGQLIYMAGGDETVVESIKPLLLAMGASVHHAGPAGSGAAVKLMVNALYGAQLAALGEWLAMMGKLGVDETKAMAILSATPACSPAAKAAGEAMLKGAFSPLFPIDLVAKDFTYALRAAAEAGAETPMAEAARRVYAKAIEQGYGGSNITGVAKLYR